MNLAIAFSDVKHEKYKNPVLTDVNLAIAYGNVIICVYSIYYKIFLLARTAASGSGREQIEEPDPCSMLRIGREPRNLGTSCLKNYSIYLFFSALAASIILFAWSCGTSSYLTKSIWKEPLACVIALRSIAYLNISE